MHRLFTVIIAAIAGASAAAADTNVYAIQGPGAAITWQAMDGSGTQVLLFAFSHLVPQSGAMPAPGPRVTFSVIRNAVEDGVPVRRQWYGDYPLEPRGLTIGPDLGEAVIDTIVGGTLVEQRGADVNVRRDSPGRLQIRWSAAGPHVNASTAFVQQASPYSVALQAVGPFRPANVTATLTIAYMGHPLTVSMPGTLFSPNAGLLTATVQ